jgi:hypothetical protein
MDRFNEKWIPELFSGCWLWTGAQNGNGYGVIGKGGRDRGNEYAHRVSYLHFKGPIPDGLQIDHLCRTRSCVNPDHLELVTCTENLLRGKTVTAAHAAKTHCPEGHPYAGDNLIIDEGSRRCRKCRNEKHLAAYYRKKESVAA